jgi:hypothetical protein
MVTGSRIDGGFFKAFFRSLLVSVRKPAIEIARNFVDDVEKFSGVSVNRERFTNPLSATS